MAFTHVLVEHRDDLLMVTMNNLGRRNALSRQHTLELMSALAEIGDSDAPGVVLAANGPVGLGRPRLCHDFADVVDHDHADVQKLLDTCTRLMGLLQEIPQPVVARVHTATGHVRPVVARLLRGAASAFEVDSVGTVPVGVVLRFPRVSTDGAQHCPDPPHSSDGAPCVYPAFSMP